jgi:hypothetical protein
MRWDAWAARASASIQLPKSAVVLMSGAASWFLTGCGGTGGKHGEF